MQLIDIFFCKLAQFLPRDAMLLTDNHASTPPLSFFAGPIPFLPPNQQRQSTEGKYNVQ